MGGQKLEDPRDMFSKTGFTSDPLYWHQPIQYIVYTKEIQTAAVGKYKKLSLFDSHLAKYNTLLQIQAGNSRRKMSVL